MPFGIGVGNENSDNIVISEIEIHGVVVGTLLYVYVSTILRAERLTLQERNIC